MKSAALVSAMLIAGSLFLVGAAGCESGRPYAIYGGYQSEGDYDYVYYPDNEVYFAPSARVYYWREGNDWHHGRDLPRTVVVNRSAQVNVRLHTDQPFTMHEQVRTQHPAHERR